MGEWAASYAPDLLGLTLDELAGRSDFLYVADSKLATAENMAYLHQHRGRFITALVAGTLRWQNWKA